MQFKIIPFLNLSHQNALLINHVNKRFINISKNKKSVEEVVEIPKAIPRSHTDILKALSSTVKRDFTGPHYKYLDDPYLTPINNIDKRTFSLSKEAGRKTARYFFENYPELFFRDISEPKIEAFTYKEIYDESMEFEETDLKKSILRCDVSNSIICYEKLIKDNKPIEKETIYDLLDLVCFYNCENESENYIEEAYFQAPAKKQKAIGTWKDNGFAEKLFERIEPKDDRVYSSIIMGMAKYRQSERAFSFYQQAIDSNLKLNTETYNALINVSFNLYSINDERWKTIVELLKTMHKNKIPPNIGTFNSVLKQISKYKFWNQNSEITKKVFNEFAFKFGIKPTLATYYHLLNNFYRSKNNKSLLIYEIIDKIADEKFEIHDLDDAYFFSTAMDIAFNLNDVQLAYKINKMAERNQHLMGQNFSQNNYYLKFLKLLCLSESIENFMLFYSKYVPHLYTPNIDLMENILKTIKLYKATNYLPQIYDDIRLFYYNYHIEILHDLLSAMNEIQKDDPLLPKFNEMVSDIFTKTNLKIAKTLEMGYDSSLQWTAKTLSLCLSILNKSHNYEMGFQVLKKMDSIKNELFDESESQALIDFCLITLADKKYDYTFYCLKFCKGMAKQDVIDLVKQEFNKKMDENIKNKFKQFFD